MTNQSLFSSLYLYEAPHVNGVEHSASYRRRYDTIYIYKLYDKRDDFPFSIVRMPQISSNIPQSIFYSAFVGEFLRIARSTLRLTDFVPKAKELIDRMMKQGADFRVSHRFLRKIIVAHLENFNQFLLSPEDLLKVLF